jgi:hypothetical protein
LVSLMTIRPRAEDEAQALAAGDPTGGATGASVSPTNFYWAADDGRIFSSAVMDVIATPGNDLAYQQWLTDGGVPGLWPYDANGQQTNDSMLNLLATYGIVPPGETSKEALMEYAIQVQTELLRAPVVVDGVSVSTDAATEQHMGRLRRLGDASEITLPTPFKDTTGTWFDLDIAQLTSIDVALGTTIQDRRAQLRDCEAAIQAGTITTFDQVDAAFAVAFRAPRVIKGAPARRSQPPRSSDRGLEFAL